MLIAEQQSPCVPWRTAVAALYVRFRRILSAQAFRILGDSHEADDVVHEVFEKLLLREERFRGRSVSMAWLRGATTYACLTRRRLHSRRRFLAAEALAPTLQEAVQPTAEIRIEARAVLERLSPRLRPLALAYYVSEMTHDEIAKDLGCSRRNVGYMISRLERELAAA